MKSCPTCHRTYPDDTLAFCLVDGSILSAPFDPDSAAAKQHRSPPEPTQVLPQFKPAETSPSTPLQPTVNSARFTYPNSAAAPEQPRRGAGRWWLAAGIGGGLLLFGALAIVAIVIIGINSRTADSNLPPANENRMPVREPSETPPESPEKDPVTKLDLAGTWTGTSDLSSATLIINQSDGDDYEGTEIVSGGGASAEIAIRVTVNPDSRKIRIEETRLIKGAGWNLGNNTGSISSDGQKMSGTAKDSKGRVYSWSFRKK